MAKHLTKKDISAIVNLVRGWDEQRLTWDSICLAAEPLIGKLPTRQSLNAHEAILLAYKTKKDSLKGKTSRKPRPASLNAAASRIANLEAELAELKEQNRKFKEMFMSMNVFGHDHDHYEN